LFAKEVQKIVREKSELGKKLKEEIKYRYSQIVLIYNNGVNKENRLFLLLIKLIKK
jgi:hypothetical protein